MISVSKLYCGLDSKSDHLRYSAENLFGPVVVYNCTGRCNLKCVHCYSASAAEKGENELTTEQAKRFLSELAEINCPVVLFSGGEPLLREDLFELLGEAHRLGLRTVISTNGTLIDESAAGRLAKAGVNYVGISIDGGEEVHDKFRASKGGFKAAISGIENCRKAGLKTGLRFTITRQNVSEVPGVFEIAVSAGVKRICFYHLIRTGRAKGLDEQVLTPEQTRKMIEVIIEQTGSFVRKGLLDEVLTVGNHADGPYLLLKMAKENNGRYEEAKGLLLANGGSKIGEKIICVGWDGNVYPDQFWRNYSLGNIKDETFRQIWENKDEPVLRKLRNKIQTADFKCLRCNWFGLCRGNFRFLGTKIGDEHWLNEPACYLTDEEAIGAGGGTA